MNVVYIVPVITNNAMLVFTNHSVPPDLLGVNNARRSRAMFFLSEKAARDCGLYNVITLLNSTHGHYGGTNESEVRGTWLHVADQSMIVNKYCE